MRNTEISRAKAALRARLRAMRQALSPEEGRRLSLVACGHVLASAAWKQARSVALYIAVRGECDAGPLLENAWATGKSVRLPLCSREEKGIMSFAACSGPDSLGPGFHGIPEPVPHAAEAVETKARENAPDLIIVPGVAFTRQGYRLGQGGGYYDRLLADPAYGRSLRMGLAYAFQIVDSLPGEPWDVPVQALATEKGLLWTTAR